MAFLDSFSVETDRRDGAATLVSNNEKAIRRKLGACHLLDGEFPALQM